MEPISHIAIRTDFAHHGAGGGYKQLLTFTKPKKIFGIKDWNNSRLSRLSPWRRYKWLHEFPAGWYARTRKIPLIHILYGEEYFRFSTHIPSDSKIVVTYHQPPDLLRRELEYGNKSGRLYGWTHRLTRERLKNVDAVIAITPQQHSILADYIPAERIHVIPLGCYSEEQSKRVKELGLADSTKQILTVGNWRRDWDLYIKLLSYCREHHPDWKFVLVNRNLSRELHSELILHENFTYESDVNDERLFDLYRYSRVQFLPVLSAAGSNAFNESLSYGLPVVTNMLFGEENERRKKVVRVSDGNDLPVLAESIRQFLLLDVEDRAAIQSTAMRIAKEYDWGAIANRTEAIYRTLLNG